MLGTPNSPPLDTTPHNSTTMAAIDEALEDLESREYSGRIPYARVARKYGVVASTLRRRHLAETEPRSVKNSKQQLLTPEQEYELVRWINKETQGHQPPGQLLVADKASSLAGRRVGVGWVYRFHHRHEDALVFKNSKPMDRERHLADSYTKYQDYFTYLERKLQEYQVPADQTYNMDEKGFAMGTMNGSKRFFSRKLWERKEVQAHLQDSLTEWVTVLACICADGTFLTPGLIYKSKESAIRSAWVQDISQDTPAYVTSSPRGWTDEDLGLQWLVQVFDRQTRARARQSWRLLYVDGHGSHVTIKFLEYCAANKILVARFPPHATHTVQPLDVVVFKSLSAAYTRELEQYRVQSHGILPMVKGDFFPLFWNAWNQSFTPDLIKKAFKATGLVPLDPGVILERFEPDSSETSTDSSGSQLMSWNQLNRRFREVVKDSNDRRTRHLNMAFHHLHSFVDIHQNDINQLEQALRIKEKRKKPNKKFKLSQGDREAGGAKWWSPRSVEKEQARLQAIQDEEDQGEAQKAQNGAERQRIQKAKRQEEQRKKEERLERQRINSEWKASERIRIDTNKANALAKRLAKQQPKAASKQVRTSVPKSGARGGRGGGGKRGGRAEAIPPPPPTQPPPPTRLGRQPKTPVRFQ